MATKRDADASRFFLRRQIPLFNFDAGKRALASLYSRCALRADHYSHGLRRGLAMCRTYGARLRKHDRAMSAEIEERACCYVGTGRIAFGTSAPRKSPTSFFVTADFPNKISLLAILRSQRCRLVERSRLDTTLLLLTHLRLRPSHASKCVLTRSPR